MRMMMKVVVDTQAGNEAVMNGRMGEIIKEVMEVGRPEASYFSTEDGQRVAYFFLDMHDSSQMPALGERAFQELRARIEYKPVMNLEELQKGLKAIAGKATAGAR